MDEKMQLQKNFEPDALPYPQDNLEGGKGSDIPGAIPGKDLQVSGGLTREFLKVMDNDRQNIVPERPEEIRAHGQIDSLTLPAGWHEKKQADFQWADQSQSREFNPQDDPTSSLNLYYRGVPTSAENGLRFKKVLDQPPHKLSQNELDSIEKVLGNIADDRAFELRDARTADVGGKRVLVLDGEWKQTQTQFHGMMIDTDGSGTKVQEIYFEAQAREYAKHINDVVNALTRIKWKPR